jgi:hypothetical protein
MKLARENSHVRIISNARRVSWKIVIRGRCRVIGAGVPKELHDHRRSSYWATPGFGRQSDFVTEEFMLGEIWGPRLYERKLVTVVSRTKAA